MTLRRARPSDAAALAPLCSQLGYPGESGALEAQLKALASEGRAAVFVAEEEGKVVGWVQVQEGLPGLVETTGRAEIVGLVVDEEARGAGVGAALVAHSQAWARERGCAKLRVRTNVIRERTHGFYERLGYIKSKTQHVFDRSL